MRRIRFWLVRFLLPADYCVLPRPTRTYTGTTSVLDMTSWSNADGWAE